MYRLSEEKIQKWLNTDKKALLIYGARQVGKTYTVRKVLEKENIVYAEYNLLEREDILNLLKETDDPKAISERLSLYSDKKLVERESVIFLDEIQCYPDIVTKIKFLTDENRYRYILSGSNLGIELNGIKSIPVGYVDSWQMFPMNYVEFSMATGATEEQLGHIKQAFCDRIPVDEIIHKKFLEAFYYYMVVGGMPAVVSTFVKYHNLADVDREQKNIINQYKADFIKYEAENKRLKIISIYDNIPVQLNKQNRKFSFVILNKELKFDRYEESFLWLKDAAVAIPAYITDDLRIPLEMSKQTNTFKLFLNDVGLLTAFYPLSLKKELLSMNSDGVVNAGALFENYTAQELTAANMKLYYYKKAKTGEVDFVTELDSSVIPIEVKSGKDYKKHAALNHLTEKYDFPDIYVLCNGNVECEGAVTYIPIYMAGFIHDEVAESIEMKMLF